MKKIIFLIFSIIVIVNLCPAYTLASVSDDYSSTKYLKDTSIIYQDNHVTIECTLLTESFTSNFIDTLSATQNKTASKKYTIKNSSGKVIAIYTLTGVFSFNGKSAVCTKSVCSSSIKNKAWRFTSKTADKNNNKAIGSFSIKCNTPNMVISKTLYLTCSKNGNIS